MASTKRETAFADIVGKTVQSIKYEENSDWQGLEVTFSDGTLCSFEFRARVMVRASFLEARSGNLHMIRDYGTVSGKTDQDA